MIAIWKNGWLGSEEVLDPELPIVDPHHHLRDLRKIISNHTEIFAEGVSDRRIC